MCNLNMLRILFALNVLLLCITSTIIKDMPKITSNSTTAQLRVSVNKATLDKYQSSLSRAEKAGLKVDVQTDFEQLLKRLTKVIDDATQEAAPPPSQHDHAQQ